MDGSTWIAHFALGGMKREVSLSVSTRANLEAVTGEKVVSVEMVAL